MPAAGGAVADPPRLLADWAALSIDIETDPADHNRIFKLGAVRSDNAEHLSLGSGWRDKAGVARQIDTLTAGARVLVGHNLRRHDLPELQRQHPGLACLELPVIDTLEWSVLAFPSNPYHRLVKGYKLLSDTRNDPVKDARIALDLLGDEVEAFAAMHRSAPDWLALLHFLVAHHGPFDQCLRAVREADAPDRAAAAQLTEALFGKLCCATRLAQASDQGLVGAPEHRFALALALGWIRVSGGNSVLPIWVHKSLPLVRTRIAQLREQV